jgi:hypothetical protein
MGVNNGPQEVWSLIETADTDGHGGNDAAKQFQPEAPCGEYTPFSPCVNRWGRILLGGGAPREAWPSWSGV